MSSEELQHILATILLTVVSGGGLVAAIQGIASRKKTRAEAKLAEANADSLLIGSAMEFVNTLKGEIADLRKSIDVLERKIASLESHIRVQANFIARLRSAIAGLDPKHAILSESIPTILL